MDDSLGLEKGRNCALIISCKPGLDTFKTNIKSKLDSRLG